MPLEINYDGTFDIATGRSRRETTWRNREMSWSDLVKKLSVTHRTAETLAEYMASKKPRQDEIKDVGGFVGGYLNAGKRKNGSVASRQLITLDIDSAKHIIWDDFTLLYGNAACMYSTHKHAPATPRLRLIAPLDRPVMADEYVAIARRIAGSLGIDNFDHTTFRPTQLMYWPSTSKDGVYFFDYQDGEWLCADEILNTYKDWRDSSEWPMSDKEGEIINKGILKQGDPLEKPGIVGAFCRTFTISEAIETFLSGEYEPCDVEDRFTYKEGSTAAGLVIYEDKYAFSHHGTDPVSGKLCNAFDLVRLHKFGLKDEDAREDTPSNRLPSYIAMVEFATKDVNVRKQIGTERLSDAMVDFEGNLVLGDEEASMDWIAELDVDGKGNYYSTIDNIVIILENDPNLKGRLAMNTFEHREVTLKDLPWRKLRNKTDKYLTDTDDAGIRHYLEKTYDITGVQKVQDALDLVMIRNSFHPVRDYLSDLQWDGEERLDSLLIDYLGAENSAYIKAVTRKTFVAAVARIFNPGCKYDYVLTLVGKQGIGKSTIIKKLGGDWYSDSFTNIQGKEAFEQIQGVWIVEIGELAGLKKAEMETVKHFISKQEDRYRVAYGRRTENFPRQCIMIGTTNNRDFLRDPTGNRRFWPVDTYEATPSKDVFNDLTQEEINQIWAEAVVRFKAKEPLYLTKELEAEAYIRQVAHSEQDERVGMIQKYLDTFLPTDWDEKGIYERRSFLQNDDGMQPAGTVERKKVCAAEIWCEVMGGHQKDMNRYNTKDIHDIMRKMEGWEESKSSRDRYKLYGNQKSYVRSKTVEKTVTSNSKEDDEWMN